MCCFFDWSNFLSTPLVTSGLIRSSLVLTFRPSNSCAGLRAVVACGADRYVGRNLSSLCWKALPDLSAVIPFLKLCTSLSAWSLVEEWWGAPVTCLIPFANENFEVNWGLLSDTIWSGSPMRANVQMWITWAPKGEPILPSSQDLRPGFWWILSVVCKRLSLSTHGSLSSVSLQQRSYFRRMGLVQFVQLNHLHSI